VNILLTVKVIGSTAIYAIKDRVDVSIYLKADSADDRIMELKSKISNMENVKEVKYISRAEALETFKNQHSKDPEILDALREIGKNPLTPTLVIKPRNVDAYSDLINRLNNLDDSIIESKNFDDHKSMLDKIDSITSKVSQAGLAVSAVFIFTTILVVYYAIRVAIFTHRREVIIMKLVGASNWFIKSPFIVSSLIYTLLGMLSIIIIFFPFLSLLQPYIETFFIGYDINILSYFNDNFWMIFGTEFLVAAGINVIASLMAISKYSKV
jgi:cell division transport system permease protein